MKRLSITDIEWTVTPEPEHIPVRGSAIASGDDAFDRAVEDEILADLEWNEWAWTCVRVEGRYKELSAYAYLGCCNYKDEADFRGDGYFGDMQQEVCDKLNAKLKELELCDCD